MKLSPQHSEQRFAHAKGTCQNFQIARSTLWLWVKTRPSFPKPLKASKKLTLFDLRAIEEYLKNQANRDGSNVKSN